MGKSLLRNYLETIQNEIVKQSTGLFVENRELHLDFLPKMGRVVKLFEVHQKQLSQNSSQVPNFIILELFDDIRGDFGSL